MWNEQRDCLRMKESVGWTSSRLTKRLLNLKRPQLNRVVQVLTGHCNQQRHKKTTGLAETSLCPKCSLENKTPNHHVGNCKLYQDICVKYFGITKTTVQNVIKKCNIKQRWSRGHKARGQGQEHKKNPRPRPRTAFPRTDTLEAKDRNARGQGQECSRPRTQAQVLSKRKKRSSQKFFKRSPRKTFSKKFFKRSTKF